MLPLPGIRVFVDVRPDDGLRLGSARPVHEGPRRVRPGTRKAGSMTGFPPGLRSSPGTARRTPEAVWTESAERSTGPRPRMTNGASRRRVAARSRRVWGPSPAARLTIAALTPCPAVWSSPPASSTSGSAGSFGSGPSSSARRACSAARCVDRDDVARARSGDLPEPVGRLFGERLLLVEARFARGAWRECPAAARGRCGPRRASRRPPERARPERRTREGAPRATGAGSTPTRPDGTASRPPTGCGRRQRRSRPRCRASRRTGSAHPERLARFGPHSYRRASIGSSRLAFSAG